MSWWGYCNGIVSSKGFFGFSLCLRASFHSLKPCFFLCFSLLGLICLFFLVVGPGFCCQRFPTWCSMRTYQRTWIFSHTCWSCTRCYWLWTWASKFHYSTNWDIVWSLPRQLRFFSLYVWLCLSKLFMVFLCFYRILIAGKLFKKKKKVRRPLIKEILKLMMKNILMRYKNTYYILFQMTLLSQCQLV